MPPPHIGISAQLLAPPGTYRAAGISGYIAGLLSELPAAAPDYHFTAWVPQAHPAIAGISQQVTGLAEDRVRRRIVWEQMSLPRQARRLRVDLLHGPAFAVPAVGGVPAVVSVPDLSFRLFPAYHPRGRRLYLDLITRVSLARARATIAISESTKRDVCRFYGVAPERVFVTHLGVDRRFVPLSEAEGEAFRRQTGIGRYIYYQGTLEPRKNLRVLVEAFRALQAEGNAQHRLVLGGAPGWGYEMIHELVARHGLEEQVVFLGYVSPEDSPRWYAAADLFVYPSAYEGFGLPPLEAMACGTPVVTANTSSLPEVVGEAGVLVRPGDAMALAEAMAALLSDGARRAELGEAGRRRAMAFTWAATAAATVEVYRRCLA